MDSSLEENKRIQTDHYRRCKELSLNPQRIKDDETSYKTLVRFLPDKGCKVLDLGCGEASAYPHLSEHDYYGVECVEEALGIARKKVKSPDNLRLGMIEEVPFEDEFFDVVWARHILEHSSNMEKTLNEILRVLKPDGLLIYALPQGKYNEPAHLYQTNRAGWFELLSTKFGMLKDGAHRFNLNEYYGVCKKIVPEDRWAKFHEKALPYEQAIVQEPFKTLIDTVAGFVRSHKLESVFEAGFGTGYSLIDLSRRLDATVAGVESSEILVKRTADMAVEKQANAFFQLGDIFSVETYQPNYDLIYHQGLLEHFPDNKIKELLELQTAHSFAVIFSVPAKDYGRQDFGDERLLELREWKEILSDFDILKLFPYDQGRHILGILKGRLYAGE